MVRKLVLSLIAVFGLIAYSTAQTRQVSGTVTGPDGTPVAGATVMVDGTQVGTTSNADGSFTISAPANGSLIVSFIGYVSQTVPVAGKTRIDVSLQEDSKSIDDVIVVAYGTAKKEAFTGSASVMKSEDIGKRQVSNVSNALAGAVAGVQAVSSNGQPGSSSSIRIRGVGSMSASSAPLYIVDGAPYDGSLSYLNSADIESISVLKDASASAIYGARGANGVVVITTKKGKSRDAVINFDAKWGTNSRGVPNYDVVTNPGQYYELAYASLYNNRYYAGSSAADSRAFANSMLFDATNGGTGYNVYTIPAGQTLIGANGKINPAAQLGYSDGEYFYTPDDWYDELFGNGNLRQEYNVSIAGASDRINYYMSAGYLDDAGIVKNSNFTRYSTRMKADYQAKKWLKVGANVGFSHSITDSPTGQTTWGSSANLFYLANLIAPIYPMYVRDTEGAIMYDEHGNKVYDSGANTNQTRSFSGGANPMISIELDKHRTLTDSFNGTWYATVTPVEGLNLTANINAYAQNQRANNLYNSYYGSYIGSGYASVAQQRVFSVNQQYLASYSKTFAEKHNFDILAGFESYKLKIQYLSGGNKDLYNPNVGELDNAIYETPSASSYTDSYFTMGILSRVQYNYDGKYFFSASYRRDASSRFHPDNRWGNFGSVGAAWLLSKENFLSDAKWIDMLKLKVSYGIQGNDDLLDQSGYSNYYPYLDQYSIGRVDGDFSLALSYKGNQDITWESSHSFNVGAEFSFWNGRLTGSVEYFSRKTSDMLYYMPVPPSLGYSYQPINVGSIRNSGVEVELGANIFTTKNFSWDVNVNLMHYKNKILSLSENVAENGIRGSMSIREVGGSIYDAYLPTYAGVDPATGKSLWYVDPDNGDYSTTDVYDNAQQARQGSTLAKVSGGFGTTLSFYGIDVSALFSFQLGGKIYDNTYQELMHYGDQLGMNFHKDALKAWTPENTGSNIPRLNSADDSNQKYSSRFLTSSNYLSVNNVTVGYTLPKKWTDKIGLGSLRIYFSGDNLAVFSKRQGLDPRIALHGASTADNTSYSALRTISGGINLTF
ncbi:MAG: TonB-dependent receptor [Alistipes sp.]|nr:TonB-dependent receptor [Alistipes sp.]